jgi:hypothetical protein
VAALPPVLDRDVTVSIMAVAEEAVLVETM